MVVGGIAAERDSARREIERDVPFASFASCASLDGDIMTPSEPACANRSGHPETPRPRTSGAKTRQYEDMLTVKSRGEKNSSRAPYLFPCHFTFLFT